MAVRLDADRRVDERLRRIAARDPRLEPPVARRALPGLEQSGRATSDDPGGDGIDPLSSGLTDQPTGQRAYGLADEQEDDQAGGASALRRLPRIPGQHRPFGRPQLIVVVVLSGIGLLLAGWVVLRARPVALAAPIPEPSMVASSSLPSAPSSAPASALSSAPSSAPASSALPRTPGPVPAASSTPGAPAAGGAAVIEIHVLGAVRRPGVVRLAGGARVADALRAAGGLVTGAQPGRLNLAQPLGDGQQLFIAHRGRGHTELENPVDPASSAQGSGADTGSDTAGSGSGGVGPSAPAATAVKINLNQASESDLDQLPGIGPVTAGKIIAWRTEHGRFSKIDELQEVDGIGPKTYADLAGRVVV